MGPQYLVRSLSATHFIMFALRFLFAVAGAHRAAADPEQMARIRFYGAYHDPYLLRRLLAIACGSACEVRFRSVVGNGCHHGHHNYA
jgi:hypothetical protein